MNKLSLGTVQFGLNYGISNKTGQVSRQEAEKILCLALEHGIDSLDTASAYGESETVLGQVLPVVYNRQAGQFRIISKYLPGSTTVTESLDNSCQKLGVQFLYGYLLHQFDRSVFENTQWDAFRKEKEQGRIRKIGFSLYYPHELDYLLDKDVAFDILQLPFNPLDQRFGPYFTELRSRGVEIHIRSAFLQGLLFLSPEQLPAPLAELGPRVDKIRQLAEAHDLSLPHLLLGFVHLHDIDKIVIGVESYGNLLENIGYTGRLNAVQRVINDISAMASNDETLILPSKWNVK